MNKYAKNTTTCCICAFLFFFSIFLMLIVWHEKKSEISENFLYQIPQENGTIAVHFCPIENCEYEFLKRIKSAETSIHCAFYDLDLESIITELVEKQSKGIDVMVIIDKDNIKDIENIGEMAWQKFIKTDTRKAYMHDKFCIFDGKEIFTGSMNPTISDSTKNNNNIIFISSIYLAKNYEEEFAAMWENRFGEDEQVLYPLIRFNNFTVENFFCPEDNCEEHIADVLKQANESILFLHFSFTSDVLGNILLEKSRIIEVEGIFEKSQISKYSEYEKLKNQGLSVFADETSGLLHDKVFIVDSKIIITGSMNPSRNGNENNDENILIIHNKEIAERFVEEYQKLKYENIANFE